MMCKNIASFSSTSIFLLSLNNPVSMKWATRDLKKSSWTYALPVQTEVHSLWRTLLFCLTISLYKIIIARILNNH
ncbi:hypothetical protein GIB67_015491 [Kingdonia uniflora]|uniref:Uncharacterized protein n=1 Tax=Kingdonia uniflora TaxID=39325 RepID=A0A7J7LAI7_9MAGN|nr:hypothetical protein GIB67_015491 [Kingdonia uniflora]